jgi:uracil-DNA glycosylase
MLLNQEGFPPFLEEALHCVDASWQSLLRRSLKEMQEQYPDYFAILNQSVFLPDIDKLFAAFTVPMAQVRFVLFGEGPYPRRASATGFCFMDGMIEGLWSDQIGSGFSKSVNRATSLRNFLKMCLVAEGHLDADNTGISAIANIAQQAHLDNFPLIRTMQDLQNNFLKHGFLLLNAALIFRSDVKPGLEAKPWQILHRHVLGALAEQNRQHPINRIQLILWGKVAEQIAAIVESLHLDNFPSLIAEHPYNLSFIQNRAMQDLFADLRILHYSANT